MRMLLTTTDMVDIRPLSFFFRVFRVFRGLFLLLCLLCGSTLQANPPVTSYLFPVGGQRGTTVKVRVGGLFLYNRCGFEMLGPGVVVPAQIERMPTRFFEGPLLPLPESQQPEDYPRDLAATVRIAVEAPLGVRRARLWTAEGAAGSPDGGRQAKPASLQFVVGDLPEIVEDEIAGDPIPVEVKLPVTINGRIFPHQDVDLWSFTARKGQTVRCEVHAGRLGSPLDAHLAVMDAGNRILAENDDAHGVDPSLRFTAPADGVYRVRIHDTNNKGGPAYVYRLTLNSDPAVERVYPLGGQRGQKIQLRLFGPGMPESPVEVALPENGPRDYLYRPVVAGKPISPVLLDLDDLPEKHQPQIVTVPAMLNGRIEQPGAVERWSFAARKGDVLALELRADQLGSPLQGVLTVFDAQGKQLSRAEGAGTSVDPTLTFTPPTDGTYTVQVADRFRSRGGPAFAYRLRIAKPTSPDFRLRLSTDAVTVKRGSQSKLRLQIERLGGFKGPIAIAVEGLPAGVKLAPATSAANATTLDLTFSAEPTAAIAASRLTIRGTATIADRPIVRTATLAAPRGQPEVDSVLLAVSLPVPFKVIADYDMRISPRGSVLRRRYRIDRGGYTGPFEVRLADRQARHLQGAHGPILTVPAGANEFVYPISLPPWMETGRTCRVCVMTTATIKDGDTEHQVSYSAIGQNDQIITVVETGRMGLELAKNSVLAVRGQTVKVPLEVIRGKGLSGPVKVELILGQHIQGVQAEPLTIPAGQANGVLTIRFAGERLGPFNQAGVVRATLNDATGPITAEAQLDLVPES